MEYSEKVMEHFRNPRNVGEIKDADGIGNVGNPVCAVPGTLIHANSEVMEIKDVKEGFKVLSQDGKYHRVEAVRSRPYRGKVYSITAHNLGSTVVTPEHYLFALKTSKFRYKFNAYHRCIPDWYMARELEKGDILLYPIPGEVKDVESIKFDEAKPGWDFKSKPLPQNVLINGEFLRLAGYYLAEGYARTDKCKGTLGFVFGSRETGYIRDVIHLMQKIFGLTAKKLNNQRNSACLDYYSARLARFFTRVFGKGAEEKHLPHWMMLLPPEKQKEILCGLWRGDGYIRNQGAKYVTISRQLAYQIRILLLRQKIIFSSLVVPKQGIHKESYCLYVKEESSLKKLAEIVGTEVHRPPKRKNAHKSWFDDNYYYAPIGKVETLDYQGDVHNLEVVGGYSYVTSSATLHNCGDIMRLYIKVREGRIADAKFKTFGCGAAIATSSMVTELVKGKTVEEALALSNRAVAEALGGLPPVKMHCSILAEDALKAAINDYLRKRSLGDC